MPPLTLAICVYNASRFLRATLESVVAQTMQDFALLIIDDCSTDNSAQIIANFFEHNPRQYELVSLEENRGVAYGRYLAERQAKTKYMMFVDADDILLPNAIERLYSKIVSDPDLMAVGCFLEYINENDKKIGGGIYLGARTKDEFYKKAEHNKLIFMQSTAIYDRELALSLGGYSIEGFPEGRPRYQDFCEDLDLWTRMSDLYREGKAIIVLPEVLCLYRKIGDSLSSNSFNMLLRMKHIKKNLLLRRSGCKQLSFIDFQKNLTAADIKSIRRESYAADNLRMGVFALKKGKIISGCFAILASFCARPKYVVDKLKHNLRLFHR